MNIVQTHRIWENNSCRRKTVYHTRDIAIRVAAEISKRTGEDIIPYICEFCCNYHVGHKISALKRNKNNDSG